MIDKFTPDDETKHAWEIAAEDAGVDPASVHLFVAKSTDDDYGAMHYAPGMWAMPGDNSFEFGELRVRIRELKDEHVLVLAEGKPEALRLLLLRHEAEHVAQDGFKPAIAQVGPRLYDLFTPRDFYGATPHERDANAAATAFGKSYGIEPSTDDLRGSDRKLFAAEWPAPDLDSLPIRLFAYSLLSPKAFDVTCKTEVSWTNVDPDDVLEELFPGARGFRAKVGDRYAEPALEALKNDLAEESWAALSKEEQNTIWDDLRGRLVAQEKQVVEDIRAEIG